MIVLLEFAKTLDKLDNQKHESLFSKVGLEAVNCHRNSGKRAERAIFINTGSTGL